MFLLDLLRRFLPIHFGAHDVLVSDAEELFEDILMCLEHVDGAAVAFAVELRLQDVVVSAGAVAVVLHGFGQEAHVQLAGRLQREDHRRERAVWLASSLPSLRNWVNGSFDWLLYRRDSWKMKPSRPLPFGMYFGSTPDMFICSFVNSGPTV